MKRFAQFFFPLVALSLGQGCMFVTPELSDWSKRSQEKRHVREFQIQSVHHAARDADGWFVDVEGAYAGDQRVRRYQIEIPTGSGVVIDGAQEKWQDQAEAARVKVSRCSESRFLKRHRGSLIPLMTVSAGGMPADGDVLAIEGQLAVLDEERMRLLFRDPNDGRPRSLQRIDDWVHTPLEPLEIASHGVLVGTVAVTETVVVTSLAVVGLTAVLVVGLGYLVIVAPFGGL